MASKTTAGRSGALLCRMLLLALVSLPATAADALLEIQERAKYLDDYQALLQHSNPSVRLAAVEKALDGNDVEVRTLALETALAGDDERIQTAALRWLLETRKKLPVTFILPDSASDAQQWAYQNWHGMVLEGIQLIQPGDEIELKNRFYSGGNLVRGGFDLRFASSNHYSCVLTARATGGTLLTGQWECTIGKYGQKEAGDNRATLPIRIDLS